MSRLEQVGLSKDTQLDTDVSTELAVGQTVFELLAQPMPSLEARGQHYTQTLSPTQHVTGQPPEVGIDRDSEPDSALDY